MFSYKDNTLTRYSIYDKKSALKKTINFVRDAKGCIVEKQHFNAQGKLTSEFTYEFDNEKQLIKKTKRLPGGKIVKDNLYFYNQEGVLKKQTVTGPCNELQKIHTYTFNQNGERIQKVSFDNNGMVSKIKIYLYDEKGRRFKDLSLSPEGKVIRTAKYQYNAQNNIDAIHYINAEENGQAKNKGYALISYDAKNKRVKKERFDASNNLKSTLIYHRKKPMGQQRPKVYTHNQVTWQSPDGEQLLLTKKPKRVIVLLTSLLNLWYETGGTAIARCNGNINVPKPALGLPTVGTFNTPNVERIIALEPDLIIASNLPAFRAIMPLLAENQIEYAYFNYINFHDYTRILTLFSKLNQTENLVEFRQNEMNRQIKTIQNRYTGQISPKVLVVFSTTNSVSCELSNSQTGVMLEMLGAKNLISFKFHNPGRTRIHFSLERIVSLNPDIILLNTMGDVAQCRGRLEKEFSENQAWAGLDAIRNKKFYVLPKEYFLYKPNADFPNALDYLAKVLYGDN